MRRIIAMISMMVIMAAIVAMSAFPAFAQGQVERGPEHARSICSFSGLNDEPNEPAPDGGRVQSYGQYVKQGLKPFVPSPGTLCNPNTGPSGPFTPHYSVLH